MTHNNGDDFTLGTARLKALGIDGRIMLRGSVAIYLPLRGMHYPAFFSVSR